MGEVLLIDDVITDFDDNKPERPCMVTKVQASPPAGVWVVPRATKGTAGVFVAAGALPGLNKDGRFMFRPYFVSSSDLEHCRSLGQLSADHVARVLENVNDASPGGDS